MCWKLASYPNTLVHIFNTDHESKEIYIYMNMRYFKAVWISISNVFSYLANDVNAIVLVYF